MKRAWAIGCGTLIALLLAGFAALWFMFPSYPHVGDSALSREADGSILLHVYACPGEEVREISVRGGMVDGPGGSNNPYWAHLKRTDPQTGHFTVNLSRPEGWTEEVPTQLPTDPQKYIIAEAYPKHSRFDNGKLIRPVSLQLSELQSFPEGALVRNQWEAPPKVTTPQEMEQSCSD